MEVWKDIKGYEGLYQISNIGNVKSMPRWVNVGGEGKRLVKERIRKLGMTIWGYWQARLSNKQTITHFGAHRLVAMAFIPNPENKPCVNHINGIKTDNRVENLEWCTYKENSRHSYDTGLSHALKGEDAYHSVLTNEKVSQIKTLLKEGKVSQYRIAKNLGVHKMTINDIYQNKTWKHITI